MGAGKMLMCSFEWDMCSFVSCACSVDGECNFVCQMASISVQGFGLVYTLNLDTFKHSV